MEFVDRHDGRLRYPHTDFNANGDGDTGCDPDTIHSNTNANSDGQPCSITNLFPRSGPDHD